MMANVSQQYMDDLGPLAAIWAGRDQGLAENTSLVNQQNTLEQIANSQQTRDIQKQKLPFEMSALEHTKSMQPLLRGQQETKNASDNQKLNKDRFDAFFEQFKGVLPTLPGGPQDAAVLAEIAQRNGMDPKDSRIGKMIQVGASGNRAAIDEMLKRIALMSEKSIQERAKQGDVDAAHMDRTKLEQRSAGERNAATNATGLERARIAAAAKAAASSKMQSLLQITKGDPVKTKSALIQLGNEALKAGKNDEAEALFQQANDPSLSALAANQQAQRATPTITSEGGIGMQGGPQPVPPAGPRPVNPTAARGDTSMPPGHEGQPAGTGFADAEKERRYQEWKKSQGL